MCVFSVSWALHAKCPYFVCDLYAPGGRTKRDQDAGAEDADDGSTANHAHCTPRTTVVWRSVGQLLVSFKLNKALVCSARMIIFLVLHSDMQTPWHTPESCHFAGISRGRARRLVNELLLGLYRTMLSLLSSIFRDRLLGRARRSHG